MDCPCCGADLQTDMVQGVTVATCYNCNGMWMAAGALDKLTRSHLESQLEGWVAEPHDCRYCQSPLGFGDTCTRCGRVPTIRCPLDHGVMGVTLIELGGREFEVDRCAGCRGMWIDPHERELLHTEAPQRSSHRVDEFVQQQKATSRAQRDAAWDRIAEAHRQRQLKHGVAATHGDLFLHYTMASAGPPTPKWLLAVIVVLMAAFALFVYSLVGPTLGRL